MFRYSYEETASDLWVKFGAGLGPSPVARCHVSLCADYRRFEGRLGPRTNLFLLRGGALNLIARFLQESCVAGSFGFPFRAITPARQSPPRSRRETQCGDRQK